MLDQATKFTAQQLAVLTLLAEGKQLKEMVLSMGISHRTIEFHRHNLFVQLGARNAAHAVAIAFRAGLLR